MKRTICLLMAVLMLLSLTVTALADGTTTLTTTVPAASYTLNIPTDTAVEYGALSTEITVPSVTEASGFAVGKDLQVAVIYTPFTSATQSSSIPFTIGIVSGSAKPATTVNFYSGSCIFFRGYSDGTVSSAVTPQNSADQAVKSMWINMTSANWGKALGGDYTATITFTSEVVNS